MLKIVYFILALLIPFTLGGCGADWESVSGSGSETPPAGETPGDSTPAEPPATDVAGTYTGTSTSRVRVANQKGSETRSIKIVITESGRVTISDSSGSVSGTLSGNTIRASVPVSESGSGVTCSGRVKLTGTISGGVIRGTTSGSLPCNGGLKASVSGTFSARKR